MLAVPPEFTLRYEAWLAQRRIVAGQRPHYHKWLRYFLDFCHKYSLDVMARSSLPAFQEKLRAKHQPEALRQQAEQAVSLIGRWFLPLPNRVLRRTLIPGRTQRF